MQSIHKRLFIIFLPLLLILVVSAYLIYSSFNSLRNELIEKSSQLLVKSVEEGLSDMIGAEALLLTEREKKQARYRPEGAPEQDLAMEGKARQHHH